VSDPKPDQRPATPQSIEQVAADTCAAIVRHLQSDAAAADASREAEREARIKSALEELARGGKVLPPREPGA
jgi:hypothetical protein